MMKSILMLLPACIISFASPVFGQTFVFGNSYPVTASPEAIVAADFDNDDDIDLAVGGAISTSDIEVYLNDGLGSFQYFSTPAADAPLWNLYSVDLDDDYDVDIVSVHPVAIRIMLNDGSANFQAAGSLTVGLLSESICFADFNGDGTVDLGIADGAAAGGIYVALGNGDGSFQPEVLVYDGAFTHTVVTDDFDGDDDSDLAFSQLTDLKVMLNNGDGSFSSPTITDSAYSPYAVRMIMADLNNDENADIVAADYTSQFTAPIISLSNGDGSFQESYYSGLSFRYVNTVWAADFNLDGCADLVSTNEDVGINRFAVEFNDCTASFGDLETPETTHLNTAVCTADFDNDGDQDIAFTSTDDSFSVLFNMTVLFRDGFESGNLSAWSSAIS